MPEQLIGIIGAIGSGKDTCADYLIKNYSYEKLSFAKKVKDVASVVFGWDRDMVEGGTKASREWREQVDPYWNITPRQALQKIGTEMFRKYIDDNVWVKAVVKEMGTNQYVKSKIVITDCRFENEIQAIKDQGGKILYIQRGEKPEWASKPFDPNSGIHITDWNVYQFKEKADHCLENNSSLEDLYKNLEKIVSIPSPKTSSQSY